MVVRSWRGAAAGVENARGYEDHLTQDTIPALQRLEGFRGVYVLRRVHAGTYEFRVLTLWDSIEDVHRFAGADAEQAVVPDAARAVLCAFDTHVEHYEVRIQESVR